MWWIPTARASGAKDLPKLSCFRESEELLFSHPAIGAPAWVSAWVSTCAHRDSNRKWKTSRDWDLEDGRLRGCTYCPEISEGPEPSPQTLTCSGHGLHGPMESQVREMDSN